MNDCLVTKLRGIVDNNNLKIFNALYLFVTSETPGADGQYMKVTVTKPVTLKRISGTATFMVNGSSYTSYDFTAGDYVLIFDINKEGEFIFTDKTAVSKISPYYNYGASASMSKKNWYFDLSDFDYTSMSYLNLANTDSYGVFTPKNMPDLDKLLITTWKADFSCKLEELAVAAPNLTNIWVNGLHPGLYGDIVLLSACTSLTELVEQNNSNLTGEIESLASALVSSGRTTGTLDLVIGGCNVTDAGVIVTNNYIKSKGGSNATRVRITFDSSVTGGYTKSYV